MIRTLFTFFILGAAVWLGLQLHQDPGYLLIALNHWTIETTLWVALFGLFLIFIIFHALLLLLHYILQVPTSWSHWAAKHRIQKAQEKTRRGLIEFSEGHWLQAKNHLIKALPDTDTPLLNYLTAARAAQEMGDYKLRDNYLREAQQSMPDAKIAVELTQAQLQLANHQWEQALATLRHLQDLAPNHTYVLKLLMHLYQEINDWPQLIALLPDLKRNKIITNHAYQELEQEAHLQVLRELIKQDQKQALIGFIKTLPKWLINNTALMAEYCQYLVRKGEHKEAESLLRHCLRKQFNDQLIEIYGQIHTDEKPLHFAESFLKDHPNSASLFLCLGRLSKAQQLWGKAKIYFEQSNTFKETPLAYQELGALHEQLGDQTSACQAYREGLLVSIGDTTRFASHYQ